MKSQWYINASSSNVTLSEIWRDRLLILHNWLFGFGGVANNTILVEE